MWYHIVVCPVARLSGRERQAPEHADTPTVDGATYIRMWQALGMDRATPDNMSPVPE